MGATDDPKTDVTSDSVQRIVGKYYEITERVIDDRFTDWRSVAEDLGVNPYRVCSLGIHEGVLWGQKGIVLSWEFKFCPAFVESIKAAGDCQFRKVRGHVTWRSRPRSCADLDTLLSEASRNFSIFVDADRHTVSLSRSDVFRPAEGLIPYPEHRAWANISWRDVMGAFWENRPDDDAHESSLKISDGSRFRAFPTLGNVTLMFEKALFSVSCRDRQLRTFICQLEQSGKLKIEDIAFGASDPHALRMIAKHREHCGGRPAYECDHR